MAALRFDILTTFPGMFASDAPAALGFSIPSRARAAGLVEWHAHDVRAFTTDRHAKTDDRPFGGGPGMVMTCRPLWDAIQAVEAQDARRPLRVLLTPQGERLTQRRVEALAGLPRILLIAGHYEGIDDRLVKAVEPLELSLGDYVLSGGELAALVLMDAIIRLLPGAVGHEESTGQDSYSLARLPKPKRIRRTRATGRGQGGGDSGTIVEWPCEVPLLDCPHFTKPRVWDGRAVPEILLSGDHEAVDAWRLEQRILATEARRPDMIPDDLRRGLPALLEQLRSVYGRALNTEGTDIDPAGDRA
ncbi:MAG: tRNA (guanine(37)-N(1))-methyltransferase [Phycisphaeraceae bacterium]|nr:tRNA (guanine(37)-N(1))-methyltransferase [Phycisphaeraceae bacterium]